MSPLACESRDTMSTMWIVLGRVHGPCRCVLWILFLANANAAGPQSDRSAEEPVGHVSEGVVGDVAYIQRFQQLRRTDPTRAQWCLERLVPLYENLNKEHPAVLEHRLSLADTLNELALSVISLRAALLA